jgi:ribose transport system substrate-binding protein
MQGPRTLTGRIGLGLLALCAVGGWIVVGVMALSTTGALNPSTPSGTAAGADSKLKHIVVLSNSNSPFWFSCRAGVHEANKDLGLEKAGLRALMEINDGTPEGQLKKLRQLASRSDVAAVGVSAIDAANSSIAEEMRGLKEKGVQVITIDSDVDRDMWHDVRSAFIGTDNLAAGRDLGRCAKALRPEGGDYVTFVGRVGAQNVIERLKGFAEGAGDKFKSAGSLPDDHDYDRARENVRRAIKDHPDVHTLVGIWSIDGPAIADVVKELDRKKDFTVVAFDADPQAIDQTGEGLIDVMVVQNPYEMGYQGVRLMKALLENDQATVKKMLPKLGEKDGDIYDTGLKVIVPDKGSPLKADLFDRRTEFLNLTDFHKWLDTYTLGGS